MPDAADSIVYIRHASNTWAWDDADYPTYFQLHPVANYPTWLTPALRADYVAAEAGLSPIRPAPNRYLSSGLFNTSTWTYPYMPSRPSAHPHSKPCRRIRPTTHATC